MNDYKNLIELLNKSDDKKNTTQDFSSAYFYGKNLNAKVNGDYKFGRHNWVRPEYDLEQINIVADVESYFKQAVQKKTNKILSAGHTFSSQNKNALEWIEKRIKEISIATNKPWSILVQEMFVDMFKWNNCMLLKVRRDDFGSGKGLQLGGRMKKPIAGYFIIRLDRCEFKINANGTLNRVLQKGTVASNDIEWPATDIIHIYNNRKPGFLIGTPDIVPVLDDIRILRRIEENVIDLIETNLFPLFHYKIGTDTMPERMTTDGISESSRVMAKIREMASSGFIVSDHRHNVESVGSESKALRIDYYLTHFRDRVLAGLAMSPIDLGMGDTANRSTASSMSKSMLADIEAMSLVVKRFIDTYIIAELLEEGGFDSNSSEDKVEIRFGTIDKEERRADENHIIQKWSSNLITIDEARQELQMEPFTEAHYERTFMSMFQIPLIKAEADAQMAVDLSKTKAAEAKKVSTAKAKPSNQHGTRSGPKTRRDFEVEILGEVITITCDFDIKPDKLSAWKDYVINMHTKCAGTFSIESIAKTTIWRLE